MERRSVASRMVALAPLLAAAGASECARPATFGAHVLYNATFVHGTRGEVHRDGCAWASGQPIDPSRIVNDRA